MFLSCSQVIIVWLSTAAAMLSNNTNSAFFFKGCKQHVISVVLRQKGCEENKTLWFLLTTLSLEVNRITDVHAWRTEITSKESHPPMFHNETIQFNKAYVLFDPIVHWCRGILHTIFFEMVVRRKPADFPKVYRKLRAEFIIIGIYRGSYEIRFVIHEQAPFIKEKEIKPCTKATLYSAPEPCVWKRERFKKILHHFGVVCSLEANPFRSEAKSFLHRGKEK